MNHRKARMLHPLVNQLGQLPGLPGKPGGDKGNSQSQVKLQRVGLGFDFAEGGGTGDFAQLGGGRTLPLGQPVHPVVHHHGADVKVAGRLRPDMLPADAQKIAVAGYHHHIQLRPGHLDPHRHRQGAPVDAVKAVGLLPLQKMHQVAGAADAGHHHIVLHRQAGLLEAVNHRELEGAAHAEIAAAGAPLEIVLRVFLAHTRTISLGWALCN